MSLSIRNVTLAIRLTAAIMPSILCYGKYAVKKKLGQYVRKADFPAGTNVTIDGGGNEGYLEFHPQPTQLWPEYYYLYPIPRQERVLNPQLEQNPGWNDGVGK